MLANRGVERAKLGERIFILRTIAFLAIRFLRARRMVTGFNLVERKHRHQMFDAGKFFARRPADALRGRFGRGEFREILFQLLQFAEKLVVFAVGDELPAFDVIGVVVPADFTGELREAFFGFGVRHREIFIGGRTERQFYLSRIRLRHSSRQISAQPFQDCQACRQTR